MQPKKIVIVISDLVLPNGVVSSSKNLADALMLEGYDVEFFVQHNVDQFFEEKYNVFKMNPWSKLTCRMKGFQNSKLILKPLRYAIGFATYPIVSLLIKRRLSRLDRDNYFIIGAGMESLIYLNQFINLRKMRTIAQVHTSFVGLSQKNLQNINEISKFCDHFTCLSAEDEFLLNENCNFNFYPVQNIVDAYDGQNIFSPTNRDLVFAGRLSEEKQIDHIIDVYQDLELTEKGWNLKIYGNGPCMNQLKKLSQSDKNITFEGVSNNLNQMFSSAAVNIISSRFEGFGMTIIEAGQFGVPSIAYAVSPGTIEAIGDGGLLAESQNRASLAECLEKFTQDANLREELSINIFEHSKKYRSENIILKWKELFDKL